jgi:hypothetical protein
MSRCGLFRQESRSLEPISVRSAAFLLYGGEDSLGEVSRLEPEGQAGRPPKAGRRFPALRREFIKAANINFKIVSVHVSVHGDGCPASPLASVQAFRAAWPPLFRPEVNAPRGKSSLRLPRGLPVRRRTRGQDRSPDFPPVAILRSRSPFPRRALHWARANVRLPRRPWLTTEATTPGAPSGLGRSAKTQASKIKKFGLKGRVALFERRRLAQSPPQAEAPLLACFAARPPAFPARYRRHSVALRISGFLS